MSSGKNLVLIGFMGTGKTSVGKLLAARLGRPAVDIDAYIEDSQKKKISRIFEESGEAHFRTLEKKAVADVARSDGQVITTGGGVVLDPGNLQNLRSQGILIALTATPETIFRRVKNSRRRPLLSGGDMLSEIRRLHDARRPLYEAAEYTFDTDGCTPAQVADKILETLEGKL